VICGYSIGIGLLLFFFLVIIVIITSFPLHSPTNLFWKIPQHQYSHMLGVGLDSVNLVRRAVVLFSLRFGSSCFIVSLFAQDGWEGKERRQSLIHCDGVEEMETANKKGTPLRYLAI